MQIAPETLRAAFVALADAHAYIAHPSSLKPAVRHRVATHRIETHRYAALDATMRQALKALTEALQTDPLPP